MPIPFKKPDGLIGRFAVVKPWPDVQAAEDENIARLQITARSLGLECIVVDPEGIRLDPPHHRISEQDVDFVIHLHFETPKAYNAFSFVVLWNPLRFFKDWGYRRYSRHLLTHDDFLSCSSTWADDHIGRLVALDPTRAPARFTMYHSLSEPILAPSLGEQKIFYAGINWEKLDKKKQGRHHELLKLFDREGLVRIHGPRIFNGVNVWEGYKCYVGPVPFDGVSIVRAIAQAGISLVLSSEAHKESELMSNRLFESLAAGAIIICDENPFARRHFGETLLYVDASESPAKVGEQIKTHLAWIRQHPDEALAKAAAAQEIFKSRFTLDRSLAALYEQLPARKAELRQLCAPPQADQEVHLMLLLPEYSPEALTALLESARTQTHSACKSTLVLDEWDWQRRQSEIQEQLLRCSMATQIQVARFSDRRPDGTCRRRIPLGRVLAPVIEGLPQDALFLVTAPNERLFSNHVSSLLHSLQTKPESGFSYSPIIFRHVRACRPTYDFFGELNVQYNNHLPPGFGRYLLRRAAITAPQLSAMRYLDLRALAPAVGELKGAASSRATLLSRVQEPFITGEILDAGFEQEIVFDHLASQAPRDDLAHVKALASHALPGTGSPNAATTFQGFLQTFLQRPQPNMLAAHSLDQLRQRLFYQPAYDESSLTEAEKAVTSALGSEIEHLDKEIAQQEKCDSLLAYCLGLCLEAAGRTPEAFRAYNRALCNSTEEHPAQYSVRVALKLAEIALRQGQVQIVQQLVESVILKRHPANRRGQALLEKLKGKLPATAKKAHSKVSGAAVPAAAAGVSPVNTQLAGRPAPLSGLPEEPPLISAIVSTYNSERFLRGCLEDLEQQTIADKLEIIVVDSGSTQNERGIVEEFQQRYKNIRYIRTEERETVYAAWNRGVKAARGKYLTNANTDDRHRQDALAVLARTLDEHPNIALVYSDCLITRTENETFEKAHPVGRYQWFDFSPADLLLKGCFVGPQPMWRREVHEEHGYFDASFVTAGDYEFWLRLARTRKFLHVKQTLGLYLESPSSVEHANRASGIKEALEAKRRHESAILKRPANAEPTPDGSAALRPGANGSEPQRAGSGAKPSTICHPPSTTHRPLPACALVGHLEPARELKREKSYCAAWEATLAALKARPFHPEAAMLLAEIALAVKDSVSARLCAQSAQALAPGWRAPKQFLKSSPKGAAKLDWLVVPESLQNTRRATRLSVCLIVKNEEEFIAQALQSVGDAAHQIIVVDTGSTDRTLEIARQHGAEVYPAEWSDDFSAARNAALEHATGDWVLILDADEELTDPASLAKELHCSTVMAYRLPIVDAGKEDEGCNYVPRLFRNAPGLFFTGRIHEQVFPSLEACRKEWGLENCLGATTLRHHGYSAEQGPRKIARNLRLLKLAVAESPTDPNLRMNYGLEMVRDGQLDAGLEQYLEAFRLLSAQPAVVPEMREALLTQLATRLLAARRFSEIADLLESPLARASGLTSSMHLLFGLACMELKHYDRGAEQMRQCVAKRKQRALTPINRDIHTAMPQHCLALCLQALGEAGAAHQAFQAALAEAPQSAPLRSDYARFLSSQGNPVDALKLLHQAVAEKADQPELWRLGGEVALSRPELFEFAADWTGEAIKCLPGDSVLRWHRAQALLFNRQPAQAVALFESAPAPDDAVHLSRLATCRWLADEAASPLPAALEPDASREFLRWYRQLLQIGAADFVQQMHTRLKTLSPVLPSASAVLDAVLHEAGQASIAA